MKRICAVICLVLIGAACVVAESSYLPAGSSGASIGGSVILADGAFGRGTAGMLYSIGGFLDIGASMSYGPNVPGDWLVTDSNVSLRYNVLVLRQQPGVPLTFELKGSFGATNSNGLRDDGVALRREGDGYSIAMRIYHDLQIAPWIVMRLGATGSFTSYRYVTSLTQQPDPEEPTIYPTNQRSDELIYGGIGACILRMRDVAISLGCNVYTNPAFELLVEPDVRFAVSLPE